MKSDETVNKSNYFQELITNVTRVHKTQFVLFGFRAYLALHLARSPSSNMNNYYIEGDRTICFASFTLDHESFM